MSTLQVANVWFESTANCTAQYIGGNTVMFTTGGSNNIVISPTITRLSCNGGVGFSTNNDITRLVVNNANTIVANSTATTIGIGAAVLLTVNSTSVNAATNTFTLGSYSNATSGYTVLPNMMKINWGTAVPNSIGSNTVTFASAFTTNTYGLSLTVLNTANSLGANARFVTVNNSILNSGFTLLTSNATANTAAGIGSVYYMAIGPA